MCPCWHHAIFCSQIVCFICIIFPIGSTMLTEISCSAFFPLHSNLSIFTSNLVRGSFFFVYSLSTYGLKETKSITASLISQNIIKIGYFHIGHISEIWSWGNTKYSGKIIHLVKFRKELTDRGIFLLM